MLWKDLKKYLPISVMKLMHDSLILSHLQFGITWWGFECNRLFKLQRRALKIMTNSKCDAHTEPLLKDLKLLRLDGILDIQRIKFSTNLQTTPCRSTFLLYHIPKLIDKFPCYIKGRVRTHSIHVATSNPTLLIFIVLFVLVHSTTFVTTRNIQQQKLFLNHLRLWRMYDFVIVYLDLYIPTRAT